MTSAVDTRQLSASPPASPATTPGSDPQNSGVTNPVALEVPVIAAGARPGKTGAQRELFREETSTALVFENGGVIRLVAAVVSGQLLFLTNKETNREVVAQVMQKRNFRPTSCYVEVKFTEPSPGFWGIEFPEIPPHLVLTNLPQEKAVQLVQAAEPVAGEPIGLAFVRSAQEAAELKLQVDALREQLKSLPPPAPSEPLQKLAAPAPAPSAIIAPAVPQASSARPKDRNDAASSEKDLLSKPLVFKQPPASARRFAKSRQSVAASSRSGALRRSLLLAGLLLATAGVAWYQNWVPWLPQPKKFSAGTAPIAAAHPIPAVISAPQQAAGASSASAMTTPSSGVPAPAPIAAAQGAAPQPDAASQGVARSAPVAIEQPAPISAAGVRSPFGPTARAAAKRESALATAPDANRHVARPFTKAGTLSSRWSSGPTAIVQPKLIKSVRATVSPEALQDFATGNVTLDALVDTSGHVKSMRPLSGPRSLRKAAMAALTQYRYEPATLHGKPVDAHVTVTIKFLFEP